MHIFILLSIYVAHVLKTILIFLEGKPLKINHTLFSTEKNPKKNKQAKKTPTKQTKPKEKKKKTNNFWPYFQSLLFFPVGKFTHSIH